VAVAPLALALSRAGATCVCSSAMDLQDAEGDGLKVVCRTLNQGFSGEGAATPSPTNGAADAKPAQAPPVATGPAKPGVLKIAPAQAELPAEAAGEAADVLARFYFDADKAKVTKVRELRQKPKHEEGLATVELEIEAAGALKEYGLGGTLSLLPESEPADVEAAVQLMGLTKADLAKWITFASADGASAVKKPFPTPCTLGDALTKYCDLGRAPTKKMLSALQPTLENAAAKDMLSKLLADADALKLLSSSKHCLRMHEFWAMLGVTKLPAGDFLQYCPRQKPREFTIASSPKATPNSITLCVSMTSHDLSGLGELCQALQSAGCLPADAKPPSERTRFFGTCSHWLATRLRSGAMVLAKTRPSALHLPSKDVPVMMVGSGAGVAPFRGFWEELRRGAQKAPASLFFGCRNADQDWLYREEMSAAVKLTAGCGALARMQVGPKRPLAALFTAFSRPGDDKKGKYVQDDVRAQATSVKHWIDKMEGSVFICGSTGMGNGVLDALAEILDGGKEKVDTLRKEGRIVAEMWG